MKKIFFSLFVLFCLPAVLRAQQWGYATLVAPQNGTTVTLLDTNNNVIKTWAGLSGNTAYSNYLMPGGFLWRTVKTTNPSFMGGGLAGRVQKVDWNGNILFDYTISDANQISHHDICPMPNGDVLLIVYEKKTAAQMTAAGATSNTARQLEKIVQLHPTGINTATIAWQWNVYDHLLQNTNPSGPNYYSSIVNNPQVLNVNLQVANDWIHMNGIDYNAELDQVVVSSHNLNEMWVIDHSTTTAQAATHSGGAQGKGGDFLYRWGRPSNYGAPGTAIFNVMHDAHWIPADCPRAGWLAGMNNKGVSANQSAIDLFNPNWNGSTYPITLGQAYAPATYGYRHPCNGYTSNMGNSQQLPNGNMLICLATAGRIYEINSNGTEIWQYQGTGSIAQAFRYSRCFIENPSINVTNNNPTVCSGTSNPLVLNTSVTATNASGYTYQWSPSTGLSSANVSNPTVSGLTSPATYTVTITTGSGGCTASSSVTVNVSPQPVVTAGSNQTINPGQSATLTAGGAVSYVWSNGSTSSSITVSPAVSTTYTVTGTNAAGCSATATVIVQVSGGGLSVSATSLPAAICAGNSAQLSAAVSGGSGNYSYSWGSPSGFSSAIANPIVQPNTATTYMVTVSDGNTTATAAVSVNVYNAPPVTAGSDMVINPGTSTILTANGAVSYVWSNGYSGASQTVTPAQTTTYSVTGTDGNGCTASDEVNVSVTGSILQVTISATDTVICLGEASQLFANASGGNGNYSYSWSSSPVGFSSTLFNPYINPVSSTAYTVTVSDGTNNASATLSIDILDLPAQPEIIVVSDTLLMSSSGTNNVWFFYGNPTGDISQVIDPTLPGSYQVQVLDANGCASPLSAPYEYFPTGLSELDASAISLFPNPAKRTLYVSGLNAAGGDYLLYDISGKMVAKGLLKENILLPDLENGLYFLVLSVAEIVITKKIRIHAQ